MRVLCLELSPQSKQMDNQMKITPLEIDGVLLVESPVWSDLRGSFREWFKSNEILKITGKEFLAVQSNISRSNKGVIRGLHYSLAPNGQAKWVTCVEGSILDVVVDVRRTSLTFGKYLTISLHGNEGNSLFIEGGLAHGFLAIEDKTIVSYILDSPYEPELEYEIQPFDPDLDIDWKLELLGGTELIMSQKDAEAPTLAQRFIEGKLPD